MKTKVYRKTNTSQRFFVLNRLQNVKLINATFTMSFCAVMFLNLVSVSTVLCNSNNDIADQSQTFPKFANESLSETRMLFEDTAGMVWSQFLEDYVLSQNTSSRTSKDLTYMSNGNPNDMFGTSSAGSMSNPQSPISYHSSAYKRFIPSNNPNVYITKRIGEDVELEPHMRPPVKVVNPQFRPMTNQMINQQQQQQQQSQQQQQPGFLQSLFGLGGGSSSGSSATPMQQQQQQYQQQQRPSPPQPLPHQQQQQQHHPLTTGGKQTFRAVSENDLYLLGAIEKLVYRVDYLESRVRRSEQLIYYLMAGNQNHKEVRDPCPTNFTRISDNCYYINSAQQVNWKTANSACKALSAHLAEFERVSENEEIMAYLLNQPNHRGRDFWLGGLNPGLLWIWSNSAKPVNPNMNLTSIAMSQKENGEQSKPDDGNKVDASANATVLNNTVDIKGQGRCLRLSYNQSKHSYAYYGQECTSRHHYICEFEDKTLDNKIKKITRDLKLPNVNVY